MDSPNNTTTTTTAQPENKNPNNTTTTTTAQPENKNPAAQPAAAAPTPEQIEAAKAVLAAAKTATPEKERSLGERADDWVCDKVFATTVVVNEHPKTSIVTLLGLLAIAAGAGYYAGKSWGGSSAQPAQ